MGGKMARFQNLQRIHRINDSTVIGFCGEMSDMQEIMSMLDDLMLEIEVQATGEHLGPDNIYHYLVRVLYHRRNKFDPFYNLLLVGGMKKDGTPFLGRESPGNELHFKQLRYRSWAVPCPTRA